MIRGSGVVVPFSLFGLVMIPHVSLLANIPIVIVCWQAWKEDQHKIRYAHLRQGVKICLARQFSNLVTLVGAEACLLYLLGTRKISFDMRGAIFDLDLRRAINDNGYTMTSVGLWFDYILQFSIFRCFTNLMTASVQMPRRQQLD